MRGVAEWGVGGVVRGLVGAWLRGWTAFVAATGEPYLSMAGREWPRVEAPRQAASHEGGGPEEDGAGWRRSA